MTYCTKRDRLRRGSTVAHPKGQFGSLQKKNPFKGIACSNGSSYGQKFFRHIEGARDTRPRYHTRHRWELLDRLFDPSIQITPHRDSNPIPCAFIP